MERLKFLASVFWVISLTACAQPVATKPETQQGAQRLDVDGLFEKFAAESSDAGGKGVPSAQGGRSTPSRGIIRPPEFFRYRELVQERLRKSLTWEADDSELVAAVSFSIDQRGAVSDIALRKSSGNPAFDEAALGAVRKSSPFPAPTESVYGFFSHGFIANIRSRE